MTTAAPGALAPSAGKNHPRKVTPSASNAISRHAIPITSDDAVPHRIPMVKRNPALRRRRMAHATPPGRQTGRPAGAQFAGAAVLVSPTHHSKGEPKMGKIVVSENV